MRGALAALACSGALLAPAHAQCPPGQVVELAARLAAGEGASREAAARQLGRCGAPAITPLIASFAAGDPYLAGTAAIALGEIGAASAAPLAAALADARDDVRRSAAIALARLGPAATPALPALVGALADPQAPVRANAATALGMIGAAAREARAPLVALLPDRDEDVRRAARIALAHVDPAGYTRPRSRDEVVAALERLVPPLMAEHHVPAVSIALVENGAPGWSKAWGTADTATGAPATRETLFEAASMSKPVFALLALQLVDHRRLDLDRPLVAYGAELAVPDQPGRARVTARMALSHTTGFPNWRPGGEERESPLPLLFEPGSRFGYSGEGMFFLQRAVERIDGRPLDALARAALFGPLGLERSSYTWSEALERDRAAGHAADGARLEKSKYTHPNAAYTLYTTAGEYARLLVFVMDAARSGSALLSRRAAREMLRPQVRLDARDPVERPGAGEGRSVAWGLGWAINTTGAGEVYHHSGANQTGFRCFAQFSPARRTGLVILTNGQGGGELWTRLVAAIGDY